MTRAFACEQIGSMASAPRSPWIREHDARTSSPAWRERRIARLVERARGRDRAAFGRLWDRHARLVHAILLSMAPEQDVEDLMQEVALLAWRRIDTLENAARFTPWLSTIARNLGRDSLKRPRGAESLQDQHEDELTERSSTTSLSADDVMTLLRSLPEPYREPLALRLILELSAREISARTGLTEGSVRVNLCRGMKLLRAAIEGGSNDADPVADAHEGAA